MAHRFAGDPSMLESAERKRTLPAEQILTQIGIKKEDTIIDYGSGTGYFSIPAARMARKVIAIDISERMVEELRRRAAGLENIEIINAGELPSVKADLILVVAVLHEIDDPKEFLLECFTRLNEGGRVVVIDWKKEETGRGPPLSHRIAKEEVVSMAGRKAKEHELEGPYYFLEFRK